MSQVPPAVRPSEEQLRNTLHEVLSRSDYQTGTPSEPSEGMLSLLATLLRWLLTPFRWIFEMTEGLPDFLRWVIVVVLSVVLVAVFVHMAWTLIQAMGGGRRTQRGIALPSDMAHTELSVAELEQAAEQAAVQGELIEAVRYLFRATLTSLSEREKKRFRRGMTNRQYLQHYRDTSLSTPLQVFVSTIELKWYGDEPCDNQDYDHCRTAYQEIGTLLRGGSHLNAS
jgi:hypothetical protein